MLFPLNYRQGLEQLVPRIEQFATILDIHNYGGARMKDTAKVKPPEWIPAVMRDYGAYLNGTRLTWESKGSVTITGHIDLLPLARIYQS